MIITVAKFYPPSNSKGVTTRRIRGLVRIANLAILRAGTPRWSPKGYCEWMNRTSMTQFAARDGGFVMCYVEIPDDAPESVKDGFVMEIQKLGKNLDISLTDSQTTV